MMFNTELRDEWLEKLEVAKKEYEDEVIFTEEELRNLFNIKQEAFQVVKEVEKFINSIANKPKELIDKVEQINLEIRDFESVTEKLYKDADSNFSAILGTTCVGLAMGGGTLLAGTAIAGTAAVGSLLSILSGPVGWCVGLGAFLASGAKNKGIAEKAQTYVKEIDQHVNNLKKIQMEARVLQINTYEHAKSIINIELPYVRKKVKTLHKYLPLFKSSQIGQNKVNDTVEIKPDNGSLFSRFTSLKYTIFIVLMGFISVMMFASGYEKNNFYFNFFDAGDFGVFLVTVYPFFALSNNLCNRMSCKDGLSIFRKNKFLDKFFRVKYTLNLLFICLLILFSLGFGKVSEINYPDNFEITQFIGYCFFYLLIIQLPIAIVRSIKKVNKVNSYSLLLSNANYKKIKYENLNKSQREELGALVNNVNVLSHLISNKLD